MRLGILAVLLLGGCGAGSEAASSSTAVPMVSVAASAPFTLAVRVTDEAGLPPAGATLEVDGVPVLLDVDGRAPLPGLMDAATLVARAPGFLPEPAVFGREDAGPEKTIRLRASAAPGGALRIAIHVGGDVMLGRRLTSPSQPDTCFVTTGDGGVTAGAAVASLAPLFRAADLRLANLETVVGNFPDADAYPGKRFLFKSVPETVQALQDLGVDVAGLANDHARDWLEAGLAATIAAFDAAGIRSVGAGLDAAQAAVPAMVDVAGVRVGVLAYTSIHGDYANDAYPDEAAPVPPSVDPDRAFEYASRVWGFGADVPLLSRRIKTAWQALEAAEAAGADRAALWASATSVYPELQDWIARRGHGGANSTSSSRMPLEIAAARAAGCGLIVVMLNNGHELMDAPAESAARYAREAVDAGADLVVHHARVPQGFEFYNGRLICMGLGNAVSDQDLLGTFLSGVLRVVFEGPVMIEARILPITLLRYRPAPLAGRMAGRVMDLMRERSASEAVASLVDGVARSVVTPRPAGAVPAAVAPDGLLTPWNGASTTTPVAAGLTDLPGAGLVRSRAAGGGALPGILFGRDLLRWGSFEDDVADGASAGGPQWNLFGASTSAGIPVTAGAPSGERTLQLTRGASSTVRVRLRPVAAVPVPAHRLWTPAGPADGPASYSLRFFAKRSGTGDSRFTLDVYGDAGQFLRSVEFPFLIPADGAWHEAMLDLPAPVFGPVGALEAESVMLYVGLHPPDDGVSDLRMDDLRLLEWRAPDLQPDGYYEVDSVRAAASAVLELRPE